MTDKTLNFEVYTRITVGTQEDMLFIRLKLGDGLPDYALRHINLETKDFLHHNAQPLKATIGNIIDKHSKQSRVERPDDEECEACQ